MAIVVPTEEKSESTKKLPVFCSCFGQPQNGQSPLRTKLEIKKNNDKNNWSNIIALSSHYHQAKSREPCIIVWGNGLFSSLKFSGLSKISPITGGLADHETTVISCSINWINKPTTYLQIFSTFFLEQKGLICIIEISDWGVGSPFILCFNRVL